MSPGLTVAAIILSIAILVYLTVKVKLHPFFALTAAALFFGIITGQSIPDIITAFSEGLGGTISSIGVVIAIGTVLGALLEKSGAAETMAIPVTLVGYYLGSYYGKKFYFLPESAKDAPDNSKKLPSASQAFIPIILPILLMFLNTIAQLESKPLGQGFIVRFLEAVGQPVSALLIGLIIAFITYRSVHPEDKSVWTFDGEFGEALKTAGQIVLIVGAGGAFASVLKTSNLEALVTSYFSGLALGILVPFIIGAIFRTAIGSGTVGMITAASMLLPLIDILGLNTTIGRVIAMLACAAGGFMVFHGNDDFFWVITTTSEMKPDIAYRTIPIISVAQAVTALILVFILQMIFL